MAPTSRRRFLAWLAVASASAAVAVTSWRVRGYKLPPSATGKLTILAPWQFWVIELFAQRILHPEGCAAALFIDEYISGLSRSDRRDLLRFVAYVEHVAPALAGYGRRFTALDPAARDGILARLENSEVMLLRAGFQGLKGLSLMAFYRQPRSWVSLGFPGPVVKYATESQQTQP